MNLQTIIPTSHILEWRRHIHQHPELSHQEKETAAYIRAQLEKIGVDEIVSPTPTSLIATINGGVQLCNHPLTEALNNTLLANRIVH